MAGSNGVVHKPMNVEEVSIEGLSGDDVYTTERGFKLKIISIPWDLLVEARSRVPMPEPPLLQVYNQAGEPIPGKFDQNYMDPTYTKSMDEYQRVIQRLTWQVMAAYGIVAYGVPEGYFKPEDDDWAEELTNDEIFTVSGPDGASSTFKITVPGKDQPRRRFAEYLRLYVLTRKDVDVLNDALLHGLGKVLEKDVEEANDSFRGDDRGVSDSGDAPTNIREATRSGVPGPGRRGSRV